MMVVPIEISLELSSGQPRELFGGRYDFSFRSIVSNYDVTADGKLFLMVKRENSGDPDEVRIVLNWFEELKRMDRARGSVVGSSLEHLDIPDKCLVSFHYAEDAPGTDA